MVETMRRGAMPKRSSDADLVLHVLDRTAFFTEGREARRGEDLVISYRGDVPVTLRINGRGYRFEGGILTVHKRDLLLGANVCGVSSGDRVIPCEGLIAQGGYVLPAGITDKAYVLDLYARCTALAHACEALENELEEHNKHEAFTDDIFDIG